MTCPQCEKCGTPMRDTGFDQAVWHSTYQCDTCLQTRLRTAPRPLTSVIEWVPVSERLPEESGRVLFVDLGGCVQIAFYDHDECEFEGEESIYEPERVTHWCPLPRPPAGETL